MIHTRIEKKQKNIKWYSLSVWKGTSIPCISRLKLSQCTLFLTKLLQSWITDVKLIYFEHWHTHTCNLNNIYLFVSLSLRTYNIMTLDARWRVVFLNKVFICLSMEKRLLVCLQYIIFIYKRLNWECPDADDPFTTFSASSQ